MAGDEVGRNDVIEGEANNRMGVYTSCTSNLNKNSYVWYLLGAIE